jgi:pimeloyl-ACP methyl ester carboxylesterase
MKRSQLIGIGAAAAAAAVGAAVLTHRSVTKLRARTNPELDPLYDLPADVVHHQIPTRDAAVIHAIERGEGRPLLLIHGITLQAWVWSPQLHQLSDRFRVIAVDVRGHGRSTVGSDGVGREVAARDVAEVLAHFDLREAVVVGHSMGGMILMEFAGDHPDVLAERVAGLVFMDTAAFQILPPLVQPVGKAMGRRLVGRVEAGKPVPQRQIGDDDMSWFMTRLAFGADPPAKAVDQVRRFLAEVPQSTSLPSGVDLLDHDARDALAATATPSLVLVGSRDLLTPVWAARRIATFLPDARLEVLPGAGHQLMQERPFEVAELLDAFVARIGAAPPRPLVDSVANSATNGQSGAR